jgi:hypothetical protein
MSLEGRDARPHLPTAARTSKIRHVNCAVSGGDNMLRAIRVGALLAAAVAAACNSGSGATTSTATVGATGGVVTTEHVRLDIPAGALQASTQITLSETTPPGGTVRRVEIEPAGLALASTARISVADDGSQAPFKLVGVSAQSEAELGRCCHDTSLHQHSGEVTHLGTVELRHGKACPSACPTAQICDDGVCATPDVFCQYCGQACGPSGCDGWMCGCNGETCGCHLEGGTCCSSTSCCSGHMCCMGTCGH